MIVAGVASMPSRREALRHTLNSILPQVNKVIVYLNEYKDVPEYLNHPKIQVFRSQDYIDYSDSGKFFCVDKIKGYYFALDDDLIYRYGYVNMLIDKIEKYRRKAIVGIHGVTLHRQIKSYYKNRIVKNFARANYSDTRVHILGTGVCAFHTDALKLSIADFKINHMADIWLGIAAQKQRVPMICVTHTNKIVELQPLDYSDSICEKFWEKDYLQTVVANKIRWKIH